MSNTLKNVTIRMDLDEWERLKREYPSKGGAWVIRKLIREHLTRLENKKQELLRRENDH
jgi:hypothetical protein